MRGCSVGGGKIEERPNPSSSAVVPSLDSSIFSKEVVPSRAGCTNTVNWSRATGGFTGTDHHEGKCTLEGGKTVDIMVYDTIEGANSLRRMVYDGGFYYFMNNVVFHSSDEVAIGRIVSSVGKK